MSIFSPFFRVSKFVSDAAGLEKTLRLLQSISQIAAAYALSNTAAAPWLLARKQLALSRRYLRIFKFIDAFTLASASSGADLGVIGYLEFGKWSCLGIYLLLESCTMLDTMGIYPVPWAAPLFLEGMKYWFCSLTMSILLSVIQLWKLDSTIYLSQKGAEESSVESEKRAVKRKALLKKLATDVADIFIPGTVTGWMATSFAGVGWVSVLSTILSGSDVWVKVHDTA